ncbi:hypothetical protein [Actinomadura miaoliensis]|uniref:hypothetical protein n=1 Tax=Actinomadura miaoliensis TaxID=430685 RepID=UPI0031E7D45B
MVFASGGGLTARELVTGRAVGASAGPVLPLRTGCAPPPVGGAPTVLVPIASTLTILVALAPTVLVLVASTLTVLVLVTPTVLVALAPTVLVPVTPTVLVALTSTVLVLVAPALTILIAVAPTILVAIAPALTISVEAAVTVATSVPVPVPVANGITVAVPATSLVPSLVAVAEAALAALGVESTGGGRTSCAPLLLVLARASAEWTSGAPLLIARAPANVGALFVAPLARGSGTIRGPPERSIARAFVPPVLGPVLPVTCRTIFPAATRARSARTRSRRWTAAPPRVIA